MAILSNVATNITLFSLLPGERNKGAYLFLLVFILQTRALSLLPYDTSKQLSRQLDLRFK